MHQGQEAAKKLVNAKGLSEGDKQHELSKIAKAVSLIEQTGRKGRPANAVEKRLRVAARETSVKKARATAKKVLEDKGYLDQFGGKKSSRNAKGKKQGRQSKASASGRNGPLIGGMDVQEFQAAVGSAIPKLKSIGLTDEQIDQVLEIIQELVTG